MNGISRWAGRHRRLAITLLIGCEVTNALGGLLLGANTLGDWPTQALALATLSVLTGAVWLRKQAAMSSERQPYVARRWWRAGAFWSNWLLFLLIGGYWGHTVRRSSTDWAAQAGRRIVIRSDTLIKPMDTIRKPVIVRDEEGYISSRSQHPNDVSQSEQQKNKRFGFVMLFLLGIFLTYASAVISCSIACSGYGALAAVTFALGLGFMAGGVYFLGRATERPIVPLREQPPKQQRRTWRRFWLSWLILVGIFSISLLTCGR